MIVSSTPLIQLKTIFVSPTPSDEIHYLTLPTYTRVYRDYWLLPRVFRELSATSDTSCHTSLHKGRELLEESDFRRDHKRGMIGTVGVFPHNNR